MPAAGRGTQSGVALLRMWLKELLPGIILLWPVARSLRWGGRASSPRRRAPGEAQHDAAERVLNVQAFGDLDTHRTLVLRTGHIEQDGTVVMTRRAPSPDAETSARERADRATHGDDERFIFPGNARSSPGGG
jgi:hypothetical protein